MNTTKLLIFILFIFSFNNEQIFGRGQSQRLFTSYILIEYNLDIQISENNEISLIFNIHSECSRREYILNDGFFDHEMVINNEKDHPSHSVYFYTYFLISDYYDFEDVIEPYFQAEFVSTITENYFLNNDLLIIIVNYPDGSRYKNERIIRNDSNQYSFIVEDWYPSKLHRSRCLNYDIYIFQIRTL